MMKYFPQVNKKVWGGVQKLSQISPFNRPNIIDHILENPGEWDVFINHSDKLESPVLPGPYASFDY